MDACVKLGRADAVFFSKLSWSASTTCATGTIDDGGSWREKKFLSLTLITRIDQNEI
jgi:hypothetical protein